MELEASVIKSFCESVEALEESWGNLKGLPKDLLDSLKADRNSAVGPKSTFTHFPLGGEDVPSILDKLRELLVTEHTVHAAIFFNKKWVTIYNVTEDDLDPDNLRYCTDAYLIGSPLELRRKHIRRGFITHDDYEGGAVGTDKATSYARSAGISRGAYATFNQGKRTRFKSLLSASKSRKDINESWGNLKGLPKDLLDMLARFNRSGMNDPMGPKSTFIHFSNGIKDFPSISNKVIELLAAERFVQAALFDFSRRKWILFDITEEEDLHSSDFRNSTDVYIISSSPEVWAKHNDRKYDHLSLDDYQGGAVSKDKALTYIRSAGISRGAFTTFNGGKRVPFKNLLSASKSRKDINESWGNLRGLPEGALEAIKDFNRDHMSVVGPSATYRKISPKIGPMKLDSQLNDDDLNLIVYEDRSGGFHQWCVEDWDECPAPAKCKTLQCMFPSAEEFYLCTVPEKEIHRIRDRNHTSYSAHDSLKGGTIGSVNARLYAQTAAKDVNTPDAMALRSHSPAYPKRISWKTMLALSAKRRLNESWGNLKTLPKDLLDKIRAFNQSSLRSYTITHDAAVTFFPYSSTSFNQLSDALKQYQEAGGPYNSFSEVALKGDGQSWSFHPTTRSLGPSMRSLHKMIDKGKCDVYWFVTPAASGWKHYERTRAAERRLDDYDGGAISADLATTYILNATNRSSHQRLLSLKDHPTKGPHIMDLQTGGHMKTFNNGARIRLRDMRFEHEQFGSLNESWGNLRGLPKALLAQIDYINSEIMPVYKLGPKTTYQLVKHQSGRLGANEDLMKIVENSFSRGNHVSVAMRRSGEWVVYPLGGPDDLPLHTHTQEVYVFHTPQEVWNKYVKRPYRKFFPTRDDYDGGSVSAELAQSYNRTKGFGPTGTFNGKRRVSFRDLRARSLKESWGNLKTLPKDLLDEIHAANRQATQGFMFSIVPESTVWFFPEAPGSSREALLMFSKLLDGIVAHYIVAAHKHLYGWELHYSYNSLKDALNDTPGDVYIFKVPFKGGDKHYSRHYRNKVVDDYQGGSVSADLASTYARNAGQKLNAGSLFHKEPTFNDKRRVAISTLRSLKSFSECADLSESFGQSLQYIPNDLKKAIANHNQHIKSERMWSGLQITAHSMYDIMTNREAQREWNSQELLSVERAKFFCVFVAGTWLVFPKTYGTAPHLMPSEKEVYVIYVNNHNRFAKIGQRKEQRKVQDPYDTTFRGNPTGTLKLADVNLMLKLRGGKPIPSETRVRNVETPRVATRKASEWLRLLRK